MSKRKDLNSNIQINNTNQKHIAMTYFNLEKKVKKEILKSKMNIKEKGHQISHKPKLSDNIKESYMNKNNENSVNIYDSKTSAVNIKNQGEKQKNITNSNKLEKNIIPIFYKKILIENKENANSKLGKNYVLIKKDSKTNKFSNENNNNINSGYIIITSRGQKTSPKKYQLDLDNNNEYNCYNNNSIMISNSGKFISTNKTRIIRLKENLDLSKNLEPLKREIITFQDISIIKDKKKTLKKCLSRPNFPNYGINNTNATKNNFIHNILYNSRSNEKINFEKYKKQQHITSNHKNNNLYSYQIQAPQRNINSNKKKYIQQPFTINLQNNNNNVYNYQKIFPTQKCSYQNIIREFMEKNKNPERRNKSGTERQLNVSRMKNQVNNNNININNVYINLDSMNDEFFSNKENKTLIKEKNKKSYTNIHITLDKLDNKNNRIINNNQIIDEIKTLWKKLGGINEQYKINFVEKINILNNDDKLYLYTKEKKNLTNLLNILENLNKNLEQRKSIHLQLKNMSNLNNNNNIKVDFISKLLMKLRKTTIDIINFFVKFKKEISYDIINNKYNLTNIYNFPHSCLIHIENDTSYLYSHEILSSLFRFSKFSDPFLLNPSKEYIDTNKNYYILPISDYEIKEIKKANYFLIKEKMFRESQRRNNIKSSNNFNNNSILVRYMNNSSNNLHKNRQKSSICSKVNCFEIINNKIKKFKKDDIKCCSKTSQLNINDNKKINRIIIPCSKIFNYEYKNNRNKKFVNNNIIFNNNNFEILKRNNKINKNKNYSISNQISNFEILKNNDFTKINHFKNSLICNKINNIEIKGIYKNNNIQKNNQVPNNNINQNIINQKNIVSNIPNRIVCPYIINLYPQLDILYKAYLPTVNNDIKISFKINSDIYYYLSLGVSPKIILFKEKNTFLYGIATLSYDPSQLNKKALIITSISCSSNYSIINTLLQLVDYCNKEIEYDELILYLYFYENVNKKGEYLLNEEYKNMIKSNTLFKWTALENSGNERKIKYHYKKSFDKNYKENKKNIKILNSYVHIKFYRFIKYNSGSCDLGLTTQDYTSLFNIFDLMYKYNINFDDKTDDLNIIFTKLEGLKKKRLLKLITEFNYSICNNLKPFFEELRKSDDKLFSEILIKRFFDILKTLPKDTAFNSLGFYCCDIKTNFSSIIKRKINGYEYNIISIDEFNIETFRLNNDIKNEDYNNYIYFFKSQNASISFLVYELNLNEENNIMNNNTIIDNKKKMFYKLLKRILTKDNDEPVKLYKKIGIPSFKYYIGIEKEKENIPMKKIANYDILDGNDWFNFCIENNKEQDLFSFPEQNIINEDIKIINNSFIIAIINPELTVDYQIPALNIYYINKNCWNKR